MMRFPLSRYFGPGRCKCRILCLLAVALCLASIAYAQNPLLGKWRALDDTNIIHGFAYFPEIKFRDDGTLDTGIRYKYRIIDDSKFAWELPNGAEKIYKYQVWGDLLLIYSLQAPDNRARFKRVK